MPTKTSRYFPMTHKQLQDPQVVREITASFKYKTMSVRDLASYYGVSISTVNRILAEAGLVTLSAHKTKKESALLEFLKLHNIKELSQLQGRLLTDQSAQSYFNNLTIETRVGWLNQSIQQGLPNEHVETIQHIKHH